MKTRIMLSSLLLSVSALAATVPAEAKTPPCVKGAVIGGVVGQLVGHHALAGAAIGCAGAAIAHRNRHHRHRH